MRVVSAVAAMACAVLCYVPAWAQTPPAQAPPQQQCAPPDAVVEQIGKKHPVSTMVVLKPAQAFRVVAWFDAQPGESGFDFVIVLKHTGGQFRLLLGKDQMVCVAFIVPDEAMPGLIQAIIGPHVGSGPILVRDLGQWDAQPADVRHWFQSLMQPDHPEQSCCGEADAYWADSYEVQGDQYVAIITDEREDWMLRRPHREPGERFIVPNAKIKWDQGNPTGHGVLFIGSAGQVYCYVPGGGV